KDSELAMYGEAPRKVGEKWNVDPKNLGGFADAKNLTGTFTVEFVEIKDFQGTPCAVLKSQFDVVGQADSEGGEGPKMTMKLKGEALSHRSLADKEDLEAKITSTMTMDGEAGPGMAMHVEGPFNMTTKTTLKK
ncbi:hypothetical protein, partial [Haloferula sp. BvORR071]|uniref:hypothetical protein n=1 Tax=Haloferula sp. BvORR071 TaxID=1396141 RepID=UPI000551D71F